MISELLLKRQNKAIVCQRSDVRVEVLIKGCILISKHNCAARQ